MPVAAIALWASGARLNGLAEELFGQHVDDHLDLGHFGVALLRRSMRARSSDAMALNAPRRPAMWSG